MSPATRIYLHAFVARLLFYVPVLLHHIEVVLADAGVEKPRALSLSIIALVSLGDLLAEYPSGLFADWLGRKRSLMLAGALQAGASCLFFLPGSVWLLCVAQLLFGVATAFRTGADTALLHDQLERTGQAHRYGHALARLRFLNVTAVAVASATGGVLYTLHPTSVFWAAAIASLLGVAPLIGLREAPVATHSRTYFEVLRESFAEARHNRRAQALMLLGGIGNVYFVFSYWVTQSYLIDSGVALAVMGVTIATISLLQAATMPLSAFASATPERMRRLMLVICLALPLAFAGVALASAGGHAALGAALLVAVAACHVLFRNAVNHRLQALVPSAVRASIVSLEALVGSLWYMAFFPLGGYLLASFGPQGGFLAVAVICGLSVWSLLGLSRRPRA